MTPDDWQRGMESEADAIPDPAWARETRRAARRSRWSRGLVFQMLFQTLLMGLMLLLLSPTAPGPWLLLGALTLSLHAIRTGKIGRAGLGLASGWAALASAPGSEELLGTPLPTWNLLALALMGMSLLLLPPANHRKMTP
ncbi:hypothetical protein DESA109040_06145 [Deinococcus saxicola]|uniref:hypothetical protein n=1 Tax=Deinococcus saxicola TaxID=249406 RepID=UPI0039F03F04